MDVPRHRQTWIAPPAGATSRLAVERSRWLPGGSPWFTRAVIALSAAALAGLIVASGYLVWALAA